MSRKETISKNSIGYFNFAKGIAMVYVLFFHSVLIFISLDYDGFWTNIGEGFMAMFLIISGYGFKVRSSKKCLRTQFKLLLKPYWITAGMVILTKLLLAFIENRSFKEFGSQYIFSYLFAINDGWEGTILGLRVDNLGMFWFFWALFGGWVIYNKISNIRSTIIQRLLVLCCVILGWILTCISKVWFYCIPNMLIAVGYLFLGHQMWKSKFLEKKISIRNLSGMIILAIITLFLGNVHMYYNQWKLGLIDILGLGCIGILYLKFFVWLNLHLKNNLFTRSIKNIGFNTLWILCIHAFEEKVFPWYRLGYIFSEEKIFAVIICFALRSIVIYTGLKVIEFIIKEIKRKKRKGIHPKIVIE